ncbi:MAG: rod shape-determining protein MreD [Oscillochloris sp.]|nr:rod shape-determining protein MreD [Oscillochloris sp.]
MGDTQPRRLEEILARELGLILAIGGLALVQVTLLRTPLGFSAPLIMVLAICRSLIGVSSAFPDSGIIRGIRWGFYGGLTLDVLAATPLGSHVLAILLATLMITASTRRMRIEGPLLPLLTMLSASLIYEIVMALLLQPSPIDWTSTAQVALIPGVLAALIMTLPVFFVLRWFLREQL